jgi:hypothetical protein
MPLSSASCAMPLCPGFPRSRRGDRSWTSARIGWKHTPHLVCAWMDALTVPFRHRGVLASRGTRLCCRSPQQRDEGPPSVVTFFLRGRPPLLLAGVQCARRQRVAGIRAGRAAARCLRRYAGLGARCALNGIESAEGLERAVAERSQFVVDEVEDEACFGGRPFSPQPQSLHSGSVSLLAECADPQQDPFARGPALGLPLVARRSSRRTQRRSIRR